MRYILLGLGALLGVVSLCMTVQFCWQLGDGVGLLATMTGAGFEGAKYGLASVGVTLVSQRRWWGLVPLVLAASLAAVSVAASYAWMAQTDGAARELAVRESDAYQSATTQLAQLDAAIASQSELRARLPHGRVTDALRLDASVPELITERGRVSDARAVAAGGASGYWDALGGTRARHGAFVIASVLLELVAIACFCCAQASLGPWVPRETLMPQTHSRTHPETHPDAPKKHTAHVLHSVPLRLVHALETGEIEPTVRAVQKYMKVGRPKARELLAQAKSAGAA